MLFNTVLVAILPLATLTEAQIKDNTQGVGFVAPKRTRPAACNNNGAASPVGAGKGSAPAPVSTLDYPSMMCNTHPADQSNPSGKNTEDCWGKINGKGPDELCIKDDSGGSGPYKAKMTTEPSLANHTIYAPATAPPASEKLPLILWANGACLSQGMMFYNFLNELASQGFFIVANGGPKGEGPRSTSAELIKSLEWALKNPAILKKYGNVDTQTVIAAGQSCGTFESATAAGIDKRIKMLLQFNGGRMGGANKIPVAYFQGGPTDFPAAGGDAAFARLPAGQPGLWADIDVGHTGTYYQKYSGKIGKAAVKFLRWQFKGEIANKALFCKPAPDSELVKAGWTIWAKNGMC